MKFKFTLLAVLIVFLIPISVSAQNIFGDSFEEIMFPSNNDWHPPLLVPERPTPTPLSPDGDAYAEWLRQNPNPLPDFSNEPILEPGGPGGGDFFPTSGGGSRPDTIAGVLSLIVNQILNPLIGVLIASALVVFFIGVIKYIRVAGEEDKNEAKRIMWWGIIALFVMVAVWGLVQIVINTFFPGGVPARPPVPRF